MRDHNSILLEEFNGLWRNGDAEVCPIDHFTDCENIQFIQSGVETRDGLNLYQSLATALGNVLRIYNYVMQTGESLLVLVEGGSIYHVVSSTVVHGPILTIPAMTDFGFVAIAGRAFITPFKTETNALGINFQRGLQNEFVYVYKGDGTAARKAAGPPPTGTALVATPGAGTFSDLGFHIFAVVYETDTGYLTAPGPEVFAKATSVLTTQGYTISNITIGPSNITKRHIVATKFIKDYNGDQDGFQFFFVPGGNVDDNTTTSKVISFFDIDLLEDASHLIDNFSSIPAGVRLTTYHGSMVLTTTFTDISVAYVSHPGEPEAIDQVDGVLIAPLDGNPITNAQEFRDVLYLFKKTRTVGFSDNQDVPSTWTPFVVDEGIGASVHGVGTVLDSGGVNVDFLLIVDYSGLMLFNGAYTRPELSWKIRDLWFSFARNDFSKIQIMNDSLNQIIYLTLPDKKMLIADYSNSMSAKQIRWAKWKFDIEVTTITLVETNKLIIGSNNQLV